MSRQDKLPTDWERVKLRKLVAIDKESLGAKTPPDYEFLYASLSDVNSGVINKDLPLIKFSDAPSRARRKVKKGDVLFSTVRPNLEGYARINGQVSNLIASTGFAVLSPKEITDTDFIYQYLYSYDIKRQIYALVVGSNYPAVNSSDVANLKFSIPKSISERQAIAALLSTWDEAIEKTERLVQAKEKRFNSLLRELISEPRNRQKVTGWKNVLLGDVCKIITSNVDKKTSPDETPVHLCNYMDVYRNYYITKGLDFMPASATASEIEKYQLRIHDVLLTKDSETPDDIANSACVLDVPENLLCGYHLALLRPKKNIFGPYLNFALHTPRIRYEFSRQANGATRFGLTMSAYNMVEVPLPPVEAQKDIAEALTASQHEIDLLKQLAGKYKTQKRGLMQKMLTGQWRVKPEIVNQYMEA